MLDRHVKEMKNTAKFLMPYSFPAMPPEDEEIIAPLKQREITVDGYDLVVFFNNCSYGNIELETLQVYGKDFCFLPLTVVCKCVRKFLGDQELALVEIMHHNKQGILDESSRNIYVWTVYYDSEDQTPIETPFTKDVKMCCYDGLNFAQVEQNYFKLF
jgi:hypothetical protein